MHRETDSPRPRYGFLTGGALVVALASMLVRTGISGGAFVVALGVVNLFQKNADASRPGDSVKQKINS